MLIGKITHKYKKPLILRPYCHLKVRDTAPPFRVLEKCQELCLRDRTAANNLVRTCTSFDFQPGSRIASFSGIVEYEESTCYLTREQAHPEGIGILVLVPNSVHYTEVCLSCKFPGAHALDIGQKSIYQANCTLFEYILQLVVLKGNAQTGIMSSRGTPERS